jgi:hypothetical protein
VSVYSHLRDDIFLLVLLMKLYSMGGHETLSRSSLPVYNVEMGKGTVDIHRKTDYSFPLFDVFFFGTYFTNQFPPFQGLTFLRHANL